VELREDNNAFTGGRLSVGLMPDFVVTEVQGPLLVRMGDPFSASITVCNQGTVAGSTEVALLFSEDAVITPPFPGPGLEDFFAGLVHTGPLEPGQCSSLPLQAFVSTPQAGVFYLGAYVDPHRQHVEFIEGNNSHAGQLVFVQP
jgi:large repetitive protein